MRTKTLTVTNILGIHARAAARLVALTSRYQSRVTLSRPDRREAIDGKSILGILMLAASRGTELTVTVEGPDESETMAAIEQLFTQRFEEGVSSK
jgi:phosphocarrier protein HPr